MTIYTSYTLARSIPEALEALSAAPGPARVVAGGTDLLLDLQQGRHSPVHTLVDITHLPELTALEVRGDHLYIGAAVPLNRVVASPLVAEHAPGLIEAAGLIGGPQVRNTATLGGNVAHALPAADGAIALLAHGALAQVASASGCRDVPLGELYLGPGRSALDPRGELLAGFLLPLRGRGQSSAFRRVMRPQGVAIAILNMAVWLWREENAIRDVRIALGPAGATPQRATGAEDALRGGPPSLERLQQAESALLEGARFRTSPHRATAGYRRRLSASLLEETLLAAWERAGEE